MATSPREELVIESVIIFGQFHSGWVWADRLPDGSAEIDSGHKSFDTLDDAVADFLDDRDIDLTVHVEPAEAHYSKLIRSGADEYHIRNYAHGAPDPIQAVRHFE